VRLVRTNRWDDATRGESEDVKRWGRVLVGTSAVVVAYLVARLVTTSYLLPLGIAVCVSAIVGLVGGKLEKRRSRDSAENTPDPST
jgi:hypothetical protein